MCIPTTSENLIAIRFRTPNLMTSCRLQCKVEMSVKAFLYITDLFDIFAAPRQRSHHSSRAQGQGASRHADPFAAFGFGGFGHMGGFDDDFFGMNMGMGFPSMMNMGGG